MHIPDNYLSPSTCGIFFALMVPVWRRSSKKLKEEVSIKQMPILAVSAAFSFLIMMFNVPLPGGTTGHAVGAALTAILLGPNAAVLAVTTALVIQAVFFGDGGILALGANCFTMAFVMPYSAYYIHRFILEKFNFKSKNIFAPFISGYLSLNTAALITSILFGIQPYLFTDIKGMPLYSPYGLDISIPAIMIPHLLVVGILEGVVTSAVYSYVNRVAPKLIYQSSSKRINMFYLFIVFMILLTPLGLFASGTAWGEWGSEELAKTIGFIPEGMKSGINFKALMPDYSFGNFNETITYIFSALIGVCLIFFFIKVVTNKRHNKGI